MSLKIDPETEILEGPVTVDLKNDLVKALRSSEENFKALVDLLPIYLMILRGGKIIYANPGLLHFLGYESAEELVGEPTLSLIFPEFHEIIQSRAQNISAQEGLYNPVMELKIRRKNGEGVHVKGESISVIHQGMPANMVIFQDISLRKKVEESLRKSDKNFKTIIEEMPDGVMIVDRNQVLFMNRTLLVRLGYACVEEVQGCPTSDFIHPDFQSIIRERVSRVLGQEVANPLLKIKLLGKGGKPVDYESSSISIQFDGEPAVVAVMRDMTLQNEIEHHAALNDKLATVGTLAAGVAHEINNPLTYVLANLVFLKENFDELKIRMGEKDFTIEGCQKLLKEIQGELADTTKGGERIRDIVRGLKSFVRTNEDEVAAVDLNQTVELAVHMTLNEFKHKAKLEKDFAPNLPALTVNPGKLQQVFINLLINAAQAIGDRNPEDNKIRVRTGQRDGSLFAEFSDSGKGIPENILPRIFDPFFTTKPVGVGTGLGLSICDEIVRRYKGSIEVKSEVGKGTTFTVCLPLENGYRAAAAGLPTPSTTRHGRVLVVDDEPGNLEVLNRVLKKQNDVLSALTGLDALVILEREGGKVDAIVSDLNMPDMDGTALYKVVAEKFPGLEKRFIFITGGIFTAESREFLKTIPNPCLEKPFEFEDLLRAVSQWTGASTRT
jgi:PAS domain S-box-containing protein